VKNHDTARSTMATISTFAVADWPPRIAYTVAITKTVRIEPK
jgi:hypothetical protein